MNQEVLKAIKDQPGITGIELRERFGRNVDTVQILKYLEAAGLIEHWNGDHEGGWHVK